MILSFGLNVLQNQRTIKQSLNPPFYNLPFKNLVSPTQHTLRVIVQFPNDCSQNSIIMWPWMSFYSKYSVCFDDHRHWKILLVWIKNCNWKRMIWIHISIQMVGCWADRTNICVCYNHVMCYCQTQLCLFSLMMSFLFPSLPSHHGMFYICMHLLS